LILTQVVLEGICKTTYVMITGESHVSYAATVIAWIAMPASAPTTVPLIRMNCRSRPTATSIRRAAEVGFQPPTVRSIKTVSSLP
jgi:hypothetical protein